MACLLFLVSTAQAQLSFQYDARMVSGFAGVDTGTYSLPPNYVISYSGDYAGSETPPSPFADFLSNLSGTATLVAGWTNAAGQPMPPNTVTASAYGNQISWLHAREISYASWEASSGSPSLNGNMPPGTRAQSVSLLQVRFSVSDPVGYTLSCRGTGDPLSAWDTYSLGSADHGMLATGDTGQMLLEQQYGIPIYYYGTFLPGDVYTLDLYSAGALDGGGLVVDLVATPEPGSTSLVGLGLIMALAWRMRFPANS
jgi:PEP-CTERM motif